MVVVATLPICACFGGGGGFPSPEATKFYDRQFLRVLTVDDIGMRYRCPIIIRRQLLLQYYLADPYIHDTPTTLSVFGSFARPQICRGEPGSDDAVTHLVYRVCRLV